METAQAEDVSLPGMGVLKQTPVIVERLLLAASDEVLDWKPSPERWSVREVLAHLADAELMYRERIRRMIEEESPALEAYDQNAAIASGKYSGCSARELLKSFCQERDQSLLWLRDLLSRPVTLARTGRHAKLGQITVGELMNEWAFHDLGHIRQITELYRARAFYPNMGSFQHYYSVRP